MERQKNKKTKNKKKKKNQNKDKEKKNEQIQFQNYDYLYQKPACPYCEGELIFPEFKEGQIPENPKCGKCGKIITIYDFIGYWNNDSKEKQNKKHRYKCKACGTKYPPIEIKDGEASDLPKCSFCGTKMSPPKEGSENLSESISFSSSSSSSSLSDSKIPLNEKHLEGIEYAQELSKQIPYNYWYPQYQPENDSFRQQSNKNDDSNKQNHHRPHNNYYFPYPYYYQDYYPPQKEKINNPKEKTSEKEKKQIENKINITVVKPDGNSKREFDADKKDSNSKTQNEYFNYFYQWDTYPYFYDYYFPSNNEEDNQDEKNRKNQDSFYYPFSYYYPYDYQPQAFSMTPEENQIEESIPDYPKEYKKNNEENKK